MTIVADLLALTDPIVGADHGFRDIAPKDTTYPYVVVWADIAPRRRVQTGDGATRHWESTTQVDVWQTAAAEDDMLVPRIVAAIDGARGTGGRRGIRVQGVQRTVDRTSSEATLIHHAITVTAIEPR